jgi:peptidoglycan/LPS O-acetylase OafA/YrhL
MRTLIHTNASQSHDLYRTRSRFGTLDGLRFLCIAAVLWHHSPVLGAMPAPTTNLQRGFLGVDFFFVLSGFLITTLLLREEQRDGSFSLTGSYIRRARRILPA